MRTHNRDGSWTETNTEFRTEALAEKSHPDDPDTWDAVGTIHNPEAMLTVMRDERVLGRDDLRFVKVETTSTYTIVSLDDPSGIGLVPPVTSQYADRPPKADHNYEWNRTDAEIDREARTRPHGKITPRPDGAKAKCMGLRGGCGGCRREAEILAYETANPTSTTSVTNIEVSNLDVSPTVGWQPEPERLKAPNVTSSHPDIPVKADCNYRFDVPDIEVDRRARETPHGHVQPPTTPGRVAKCGGPRQCGTCRREAEIVAYENAAAPDRTL